MTKEDNVAGKIIYPEHADLRDPVRHVAGARLVQSAYAGGLADSVSNFAMYAGPVAYSRSRPPSCLT